MVYNQIALIHLMIDLFFFLFYPLYNNGFKNTVKRVKMIEIEIMVVIDDLNL